MAARELTVFFLFFNSIGYMMGLSVGAASCSDYLFIFTDYRPWKRLPQKMPPLCPFGRRRREAFGQRTSI